MTQIAQLDDVMVEGAAFESHAGDEQDAPGQLRPRILLRFVQQAVQRRQVVAETLVRTQRPGITAMADIGRVLPQPKPHRVLKTKLAGVEALGPALDGLGQYHALSHVVLGHLDRVGLALAG